MMWLLTLTEGVANAALTQLPLFNKGMLTTVFGLLGVFLVLALFFITIKLLQRIGSSKEKQ